MKRCLLILALGLMLTGCPIDDDDGGGSGGDATGAVSFSAFVKDVLDNPPDSEPVAVNGKDFRFSDDPDAFDDVLAD